MKRMPHFRALMVLAAGAILSPAAWAAGNVKHPHEPVIKDAQGKVVHRGWSFSGPRGHYDKASLQRGFKVYREVCAACHGLEYMAFRNLGQPGGPFDVEKCYGADPKRPSVKTADPVLNQCVKAIAAEYQIPAGPDESGSTVDEDGNPLMRPGKASDAFPNPYANPQQAAPANNGKVPPNLSLITKARHDGPNYVYSLLTGYPEQLPAGLKAPPALYYNPYFPGDTSVGWSGEGHAPPGGFIAMAPPLISDGQVTFDDGTEATIPQMAYDVVNFLEWAAEPKMEARKQTGLAVMGYLALLVILLYWSYRRVWRDVEH